MTTIKKRNRKPLYPSPVEALLARITPGSQDECWLWQGATTRNGYGVYTHMHKSYYAHRVSYEIHRGPIPPGLDVLHSCDNPACCNPHHLRAGTPKDNARDMVTRGRNRHAVFMGEQHANSKLKESHISEIRQLAENGVPQAAIATQFGVCQRTICSIVNRLTWKHVK